jgi:hypothetical protein
LTIGSSRRRSKRSRNIYLKLSFSLKMNEDISRSNPLWLQTNMIDQRQKASFVRPTKYRFGVNFTNVFTKIKKICWSTEFDAISFTFINLPNFTCTYKLEITPNFYTVCSAPRPVSSASIYCSKSC